MFIPLPGTLGSPNPVDEEFQMSLIHRPKQLTTASMDQPKLDSKTSDLRADIVGMNRNLVFRQSTMTASQSMASRISGHSG
jgi:hypothetical protein